MHLLYAKKFRLPSEAANVLQTMNMALAFGRAGVEVRCFPGCAAGRELRQSGGDEARRQVLLEGLSRLGAREIPEGWSILPGEGKGMYGVRFRLALCRAALGARDGVFYARDLSELNFLCSIRRFLPRLLVYEAHEVLHRMHQSLGKPGWRTTLLRERRAFQTIDGLVALNPLVLEEAREHLGYCGPTLLAPSAFNPDFFHPLPLFSAMAPWPGFEDKVLLVYVGNFHPGKGVETLLRALALLPLRFHLRLIGGRPADIFASLRAEAEALGLSDRVECTGSLPPQEVRAACQGAHIFIIPQQSEFYTSPLKLHEAMALGLPVITTPLETFRRSIEAGLVHGASGAGPEGLARAVAGLADNPGLAESLRVRGLAEASQHTWQHRAEKVLNFIEELRATRASRVGSRPERNNIE